MHAYARYRKTCRRGILLPLCRSACSATGHTAQRTMLQLLQGMRYPQLCIPLPKMVFSRVSTAQCLLSEQSRSDLEATSGRVNRNDKICILSIFCRRHRVENMNRVTRPCPRGAEFVTSKFFLLRTCGVYELGVIT